MGTTFLTLKVVKWPFLGVNNVRKISIFVVIYQPLELKSRKTNGV